MQELTQTEQQRYHRHLILPDIGVEGQTAIRNANVLVVGAGGLGCPVIQYLTTTGIGRIGIIDDDQVDVSNLQRQIFYSMNDIGKLKSIVSAKVMKDVNKCVRHDVLNIRINYKNGRAMVRDYDLVIDCSDNLLARYVINDCCVLEGKPFVHASVFKTQGQVTTFNYHDGPSYRCLFPTSEKTVLGDGHILGIYSIIPGIIGLMQVNEAIKIITGKGEVLSGKLIIYNAFKNSFSSLKIQKNPNNFNPLFLDQFFVS